jgi:hypothetical protein
MQTDGNLRSGPDSALPSTPELRIGQTEEELHQALQSGLPELGLLGAACYNIIDPIVPTSHEHLTFSHAVGLM